MTPSTSERVPLVSFSDCSENTNMLSLLLSPLVLVTAEDAFFLFCGFFINYKRVSTSSKFETKIADCILIKSSLLVEETSDDSSRV